MSIPSIVGRVSISVTQMGVEVAAYTSKYARVSSWTWICYALILIGLLPLPEILIPSLFSSPHTLLPGRPGTRE